MQSVHNIMTKVTRINLILNQFLGEKKTIIEF